MNHHVFKLSWRRSPPPPKKKKTSSRYCHNQNKTLHFGNVINVLLWSSRCLVNHEKKHTNTSWRRFRTSAIRDGHVLTVNHSRLQPVTKTSSRRWHHQKTLQFGNVTNVLLWSLGCLVNYDNPHCSLCTIAQRIETYILSRFINE